MLPWTTSSWPSGATPLPSPRGRLKPKTVDPSASTTCSPTTGASRSRRARSTIRRRMGAPFSTLTTRAPASSSSEATTTSTLTSQTPPVADGFDGSSPSSKLA